MDPVSRAAAAARARDAAIAAAYRKEVSPTRGGYSQGQYGQGQAYATPGHRSHQQDPSGGDRPSTGHGYGHGYGYGQGQGQASRRSASAPRGSRSALRSRARDEAEQAAREQRERELEECTFRPQTRRLPSYYGSSRRALESVPFAERMEQWKRHKVQESERRKKEEEDREVSKCTFQPRISAVSRKTVARQRQMGGAVPAHERLYRSVTPARALKMKTPSSARGMAGAQTSFSSRHGGQTGPYGGTSSASGAGLQQQHQHQGLEHTASRTRPDYKTMEERELEQCTFRPQTNPKLSRRSAHPVRSRFRQAAKARSLGVQLGKPKYTGAEECTFAPRVNPVSKAMANARKYVEKPVFERMSERARAGAGNSNSNGRSQSAPRARRGPAAEARAMGGAGGGGASTLGGYDEGDMSAGQLGDSRFGSFGGSTMGAGGSMRRGRRSEGGDYSRVMDLDSFRRAMDGGGDGGDLEGKEEDGKEGKASPRTAAERKRRFKQFLQRQNHTLARKAKSVQLLKEQTAAPHQPRLCRRSVEMVSAETHGTFLERMAKKAVLREHANQQERARVAKSADCTFEPKINRHSKQMPRRSYSEMSRGDALKRETAQRLMKLKLEQDEIGQFEFAPKINDKSRQAQGKLRVLDDPETYVERVHREQAIQAERARQQALQAESTEYDECTFKPEVHDAPEYIKRIAKTMALTRAARPPSPSQQNPRWR